ncbi:SGNH/GDSL hydrolase family protein [Sciscionella sediminilitoris]|uniref:SGNH/GDSL hydrolase family protein n=1 Tax=Sciscionella sediminilitoris TaxID=1445613 RepID=UPI0004DFC8DF|nr:SGNH/GDSL hydrolase family protein [Sciscionella sp. SE31]
MRWRSFMALGDSFTEGLDDPADDGGFRGWADRLAELLAAVQPGLTYANLAVRGKVMNDIVTEQLPIALAERPDLVTLCAGGNDLIVPGCDIDALAGRFEDMVAQLTESGADVVVFNGPDPKHMPLMRTVRGKVALYNSHLWSIADRYGATAIDLWGMRVLGDSRAWADDRLHFTPEGHRRIALRVATALGVPTEQEWNAPWPEQAPLDWFRSRLKDLDWVRTYMLPWARRQLTGRSMGDGVTAKRPSLAPIEVESREHGLV